MLDSGTWPIRSRTPATISATDAPEGCACRVARTASRTSPGGLRCRFSGMAEVETSGRHASNPVPCDVQMAVPATARIFTTRPWRRDLAERSDGSSRETAYRKPPRKVSVKRRRRGRPPGRPSAVYRKSPRAVSVKGGVGKTRRQSAPPRRPSDRKTRPSYPPGPSGRCPRRAGHRRGGRRDSASGWSGSCRTNAMNDTTISPFLHFDPIPPRGDPPGNRPGRTQGQGRCHETAANGRNILARNGDRRRHGIGTPMGARRAST